MPDQHFFNANNFSWVYNRQYLILATLHLALLKLNSYSQYDSFSLVLNAKIRLNKEDKTNRY